MFGIKTAQSTILIQSVCIIYVEQSIVLEVFVHLNYYDVCTCNANRYYEVSHCNFNVDYSYILFEKLISFYCTIV